MSGQLWSYLDMTPAIQDEVEACGSCKPAKGNWFILCDRHRRMMTGG